MESDRQQACELRSEQLSSRPCPVFPVALRLVSSCCSSLCVFLSQGCILISKTLNSVLIPDVAGGVHTGSAAELCAPQDSPRVALCISVHSSAPLSWPHTAADKPVTFYFSCFLLTDCENASGGGHSKHSEVPETVGPQGRHVLNSDQNSFRLLQSLHSPARASPTEHFTNGMVPG